MDENHPIKECRVQDFHVSVVTIESNDRRTRTLAEVWAQERPVAHRN